MVTLDIDECELEMNDCEQLCTNSPGNFSCSCWDGYKLSQNRKNCFGELLSVGIMRLLLAVVSTADIDECQEATECEQVCVNGPGMYNCSCFAGYSLQDDGSHCLGMDGHTHVCVFAVFVCLWSFSCSISRLWDK